MKNIPTITYYRDADGDDSGDENQSIEFCMKPEGFVENNTDCDDSNSLVYPGAPEVCNGTDDNCDGQVDEGIGTTTYYQDADLDGYGNPDNTMFACSLPPGYVTNSSDCNDSDSVEHPGQTWYQDADNDGYSNGVTDTSSCTRPTGYKVASELTSTSGDCNDDDESIHPGAEEICNDKDDNCNGQTDEIGDTYFHDGDGDGYGDPNDPKTACTQPPEYVTDNSDCDDDNSLINPDAPMK